MKKKKTFVKPELQEEASLTEVTLVSGDGTVISCDPRWCDPAPPT